ncbi:hypothetical protein ACHAXT_006994 [Thalassiosira profunda]
MDHIFGGMFGPGGGPGGMGRGRGSKRPAPGGTGYGGGAGDTKKLAAAMKKADKQSAKDDKGNIRFLKQIQKQLKFTKKTSTRSRKSGASLDEDDREKLTSTLADIFRSQSPSDWDQRKELYIIALDVSRTLASDESLGAIFGDKDDQEGVLYWLLDFSSEAETILKRNADLGWTAEDQNDVMLATQVSEVADEAVKMARRCVAAKPEEDLCVISLTERYQSELGPLRFDSVDTMQHHFFERKVPNAPAGLNARALFKELAGYRTALPVEYGSSCFCRVNTSRLDLVRVMITGPDDTPYANGCFFFDINLPAAYPKVSPKVQYLTTGGGKMRFNPNLYNCGKVCLSLLGTWNGPGWISGQSTLLQVLISIQSLILVPDPYLNEPGWEPSRGTPRGDAQSKAYNKQIRRFTSSAAIESHLSAILGNNNPYVEFEQPMIKHFLEKRSLIQKELWSWVREDQSLGNTVTKICALMSQLASRERGPTRKRRKAAHSTGPIVLDDADAGETKGPVKSNEPPVEIDLCDAIEDVQPKKSAPLKSNEPIELLLSDDDDEEKKEDAPEISIDDGGAGAAVGKSDDGGLIDLT